MINADVVSENLKRLLRRIFHVEHSSIDLASIKGLNLIVDLHDLDRKDAYKREIKPVYNVITTAYLREALSKPGTDMIKNRFITVRLCCLSQR
ncbi:MAG: hypothetical protein P3X22_001040 [Thermoprotei archaeon]|nr:hypothetical protein [Thermoprotei archaeon]